MREALVFGGSGQIGAPLLSRLGDAGWRVFAVSRDARADLRSLHWLRGDCNGVEGLPTSVDAIFSCGPLDHFARWYATSKLGAARVIAFGSTSLGVKADSIDPVERDIAARLVEGERVLLAAAARRGAQATVLRPTLVYGAGRDRTLTRIASLAKRWHCCVLPRGANGLRQPVHVDDLANAALLACDAPATHGNAYALPGGETLPYREMIARTLRSIQPRPVLIEAPAGLFNLALHGAQALGFGSGPSDAVIARMRADLVFDAAPALRDFGYVARAFQPTADMFDAPHATPGVLT
jgi:nucleoside-diphosphate-sugar epimerase